MLLVFLHDLMHPAGILDSQSDSPSQGGNISDPRSSYTAQANKRRNIIVEDDLRATQSSDTGGGGKCC